MKNEQKTTVKDLRKQYKPELWCSCSKITNLSDETVGYYAYLLQEELNKKDLLSISILMSEKDGGLKKGILINKPLIQIIYPMVELKITYKADEWNRAKEYLEELEKNPILKENKISELGEERFLEMIKKYEEDVKNPMILHQFDLFFRVWHNGCGIPVVLSNGYLLKCLNDAGINKFEELEEYNAVLIYNEAQVNAHICSFVKFEKKC